MDNKSAGLKMLILGSGLALFLMGGLWWLSLPVWRSGRVALQAEGGWYRFPVGGKEGLLTDYIWGLWREGDHLWIAYGLFGPGASRYNVKTGEWKHFVGLRKGDGYVRGGNGTQAIAVAGDKVYFGSASEGVAIYDQKEDKWLGVLTGVNNSAIRVSDVEIDGNLIWIGADHGGISIYDSQTQSWRVDTIEGFKDITVFDLVVEEDAVWAGTSEGVYKYDRRNNEWEKILSKEKDNFLAPGARYIWIGTLDGLYGYNKEKRMMEHLIKAELVNKGFIYGIVEDGNYLWFIAEFSGIYRYNLLTGELKIMQEKRGIFTKESLMALAVDGEYLWIGTQEGLIRVPKQTWDAEAQKVDLNLYS